MLKTERIGKFDTASSPRRRPRLFFSGRRPCTVLGKELSNHVLLNSWTRIVLYSSPA